MRGKGKKLPSLHNSSASVPTPEPAVADRPDYGIEEFTPETCIKPPIFHDPKTIEAMRRLGVVPEELVKLSREEIQKIPGNSKVRNQIVAEIEKQRMETIEQIKNMRHQIENEEQKKESFDRVYRANSRNGAEDEKTLERIKKAQNREIEQLIAVELVKKETKEAELERQRKLEEILRQQALKNKLKREEEAKKRKMREEKVIERIRKQEEELALQRQKEKEAEERRKAAEIEAEKKRKIEAEKAEKLKEEKLKKLKEERLQKEIEEKERKEAKEAELREREELRLKARQSELAKLKREHKKLMDKQLERLTMAQTREKEELERKIQKMQEDDQLAKQKMIEFQRKQQEAIALKKKRNEDRVLRSKELSKKLEEEEQQRKAELQAKNLHATERYNQLNAERQKKILMARKEDNIKKQQALERIARSEEIYLQRASRLDKKMEDQELKFREMKKKQEEELQTKAAMQWLKIRMGETNAQRMQRRQQYTKERTISSMQERNKLVESIRQQQKAENEKRLKHSKLIAKRRAKLVEEFNRLINIGEEPDIPALAERFGVDLESIKERYSIKNRRCLSFNSTRNSTDTNE